MADSLFDLKVIRPVQVTAGMLVSTNVPLDDYTAWAIGTTYAEGERVRVDSTGNVYQSIVAGNVGNDPTLAANSTKWAYVGRVNRWKAYDASISSQTARPTLISYRLKLGQVTSSVNLLNLSGAASAQVRVVDPTYAEVYNKTVPLVAYPVEADWWVWYYGEWQQPTQALLTDLPNFPNADVLIDINGGDALAVGVILLGQIRQFSYGVKMGASVGIQDYSRKERTEFGDIVVTERAFAKRASFNLLLGASEVDGFISFLAQVRATPCLWVGSNRYESTTIYGFYKSFNTVINYFDYSDTDLELEGLT